MAKLNKPGRPIFADIETDVELKRKYSFGLSSTKDFFRASASPEQYLSSNFFKLHAQGQLGQLYATSGVDAPAIAREAFHTLPGGFVQPLSTSSFASLHGITPQVGFGARERDVVRQFYQGLESRIASGERVRIAGWNFGYDMSFLEKTTYMYPELAKYRGFFARQQAMGKLTLFNSENLLFSAARKYATVNPDWASRYLLSDRSYLGMRSNRGWKLENVGKAFGYDVEAAHGAKFDTQLTENVFDRLRKLNRNLDQGDYRGVENFLSKVFEGNLSAVAAEQVKNLASAAAQAKTGEIAAVFSGEELANHTLSQGLSLGKEGKVLLGGGLALLAGAAAWQAFSTRERRQTQIEGFHSGGRLTQALRRKLTDFGSGFHGYQDPDRPSPILRMAGALVAGAAGFYGLKYLRTRPGFSESLYYKVKKLEELSPMRIGRTFRASEYMSGYAVRAVDVEHSQLFSNRGLSELGEHFQRLLGEQRFAQITSSQKTLEFRSFSPTSPYLRLRNHDDVLVRFAERGQLTASSFRYGRPLGPRVQSAATDWSNGVFKGLLNKWHSLREAQAPGVYGSFEDGSFREILHGVIRPRASGVAVQPLYAKLGGGWKQALENGTAIASRVAFEQGERYQKLLAGMGIGLSRGSYNSVFNVPFIGRKTGLLNQLLLKRVLPAYAGYTALRWADYHTFHLLGDGLVGLPFRANILRAKATDTIPGARTVTDFYAQTVPGPQYGPLALPASGAFAGGLLHYANVLRGKFGDGRLRDLDAKVLPSLENLKGIFQPGGLAKLWKEAGTVSKGTLIGSALMLPLLPGMLGSRKHADELERIYSGEQLVPVKSGRWWEVGSTPYEGNRIIAWRPHWYALHTSRSYEKSLWGDEGEYWAHNPLIHPLRYLRDPYALERRHYEDRPYPITSPAGTDIPWIGPLFAATIGKVIKPTAYMHQDQWNVDTDPYALFGGRLEPQGPEALPTRKPIQEYSLSNALVNTASQMSEIPGLTGFMARVGVQNIFPNWGMDDVYLQGSKNLDSLSRNYYERQLGAVMGPEMGPNGEIGLIGLSEPFRRVVQRDMRTNQANEIPNQMPSWMPGDRYFQDFSKGDPFTKTSQGFARLPGEGYAALHPYLKGVNPEDYPDIEKLRILGDVAPYSQEYENIRGRVFAQAQRDIDLQIAYDQVVNQVSLTKESAIAATERQFTGEAETVSGTIEQANLRSFTLAEYPGRTFEYSSLSASAADMSARVLGEHNNSLSQDSLDRAVSQRQQEFQSWLDNALAPGQSVQVTIPSGSINKQENIRAVVRAGSTNINQAILDKGYGTFRKDLGGAEASAMHGVFGKVVGKYAETMAFRGDESFLNPLRYIPTPFQTKLWQVRTPEEQYSTQELNPSMRRWEHPINDFLMPYARGAVKRLTGMDVKTQARQRQEDLDQMTDVMDYLRFSSGYTNHGGGSTIGGDLTASPESVAYTLPRREKDYFLRFVNVSDEGRRQRILNAVEPQTALALEQNWRSQEARIAQASGQPSPYQFEGGRAISPEEAQAYERSGSRLSMANFLRQQEAVGFFERSGMSVPDVGSPAMNPDIDYQDVKLKILQQEGYDRHDFGMFEDRASLLSRKPYLDGAVRELTSGSNESSSDIRQRLSQLLPNGQAMVSSHRSRVPGTYVQVQADLNQSKAYLRDRRRNPDYYQ